MWIIILLIITGLILLIAELILLPGLSVAGIGALIAYGFAGYLGFSYYGASGGFIVIAVILAVSLAGVVLSLRSKTWHRLSLKNNIDSTSQPAPGMTLKTGDRGRTVTRLAPIGRVEINGESYEAKSLGDIYIDPGREVEVTGFENFSVIVKIV